MIYDGTGAKPKMGDILIDGERIARIAPEICVEVDAVCHLLGKSVAAGFIDVHSHNDWFAIHKKSTAVLRAFYTAGNYVLCDGKLRTFGDRL